MNETTVSVTYARIQPVRGRLCNFALMLSGALALCATMEAMPALAQDQTLKVGAQGVFSGELSSYGDRQRGGIAFALSKAGDLSIGGKKVTVQVVYADDQGSGEKGPIAAQQLIDDHVSAVIGPAFTGATAAAMPLFQQASIPAISPWTSGNNLPALGGGYYFRVSYRSDCQGEALANIAAGMGAKSVVVVDDNEAYGSDISAAVGRNLPGLGIKVAGSYHGSAGITDWSPVLQRIKQDAPDLVIYDGYFAEAGRLFQQARERGIAVPFLGSDGVGDPGILKVADAAKLTNVSAISTVPPQLIEGTESPEWLAFKKEYPAFAKSQGLSVIDPDIYVALAFDATNILLDAVKRANAVDSAAIVAALRTTDIQGLTGAFKYDAKGERQGCETSYSVFDNGAFKPAKAPAKQ